MLLSCIIGASATDGVVANNESAEYQESHFQINLADYDVYVDNGEMNLVAKKSLARSSKKAVSENASKLQEIFAEFPDVKENLISEYQADDELCAVSFLKSPWCMLMDTMKGFLSLEDRVHLIKVVQENFCCIRVFMVACKHLTTSIGMWQELLDLGVTVY